MSHFLLTTLFSFASRLPLLAAFKSRLKKIGIHRSKTSLEANLVLFSLRFFYLYLTCLPKKWLQVDSQLINLKNSKLRSHFISNFKSWTYKQKGSTFIEKSSCGAKATVGSLMSLRHNYLSQRADCRCIIRHIAPRRRINEYKCGRLQKSDRIPVLCWHQKASSCSPDAAAFYICCGKIVCLQWLGLLPPPQLPPSLLCGCQTVYLGQEYLLCAIWWPNGYSSPPENLFSSDVNAL